METMEIRTKKKGREGGVLWWKEIDVSNENEVPRESARIFYQGMVCINHRYSTIRATFIF